MAQGRSGASGEEGGGSSAAGSGATGATGAAEAADSAVKVSRNMWRMPLLRGLALLALGVLLLVEPLSSLQNLIYLFSGFLLLDGILAAAQGLLNRDQVGWRFVDARDVPAGPW